MAQTLCIKCGSELKVSSYCQLCQQPLIFACTSCGYIAEEKVHTDCRNAEILSKTVATTEEGAATASPERGRIDVLVNNAGYGLFGATKAQGIEKAMFDYEKILYDSLLVNEHANTLNHNFKYKHLWVKKSTGLGVTEFFLRLITWLCLRNDDYQNSQMCIVTGPNIDIAIKLIKRC